MAKLPSVSEAVSAQLPTAEDRRSLFHRMWQECVKKCRRDHVRRQFHREFGVHSQHLEEEAPSITFSWVPQSICVCRLLGSARDRQAAVLGHLLLPELLYAVNHFIIPFNALLFSPSVQTQATGFSFPCLSSAFSATLTKYF